MHTFEITKSFIEHNLEIQYLNAIIQYTLLFLLVANICRQKCGILTSIASNTTFGAI